MAAMAAVAVAFSLANIPTAAGAPRGAQSRAATTQAPALPRTPDGKPDLSGSWQVMNTASWDIQDHSAQNGVPAGQGVVEGNDIPYQPSAAAKKKENFANRTTADPLTKCYLPGVPRITYMPFPFQILQTPTNVEIFYEYTHAVRQVYVNGSRHPPGHIDWWMGDSRGRWEGDTLVVDLVDFNDETWFDRAGNFHSDALHVVERYTPMGRDVIRYEATIEDPQVFTRPWKISMPLYRRLEPNAQLTDFRCVEMVEETIYGHLRKEQLVKHWEGNTINVDITRKIPPGEAVHERYISGNPPAAK